MTKEILLQTGQLDLNINSGIDFNFDAIYKLDGSLVDVTGYTATFSIRDKYSSSLSLVSVTESSGIIVGTTDGKFSVSLTEIESNLGNRELVYDLVIVPPSGDNEIKLLRGKCKFSA